MNLFTHIENAIGDITYTENNAIAYKTSGSKLVDLNFKTASLRSASEDEIIKLFFAAFDENAELAAKWLFFARDIRGGMGEKRIFRVVFKEFVKRLDRASVAYFVSLVPEYGSYKDLIEMFDLSAENDLNGEILRLIREQISKDLSVLEENNAKSISLLAKWLPSINASSLVSKSKAKIIRKSLEMDEKTYRKTLAKLREKIDVVERKTSANLWGAINYSAVPSKANIIYRNAFMKHDERRRKIFLTKLADGETKINAAALFPYEIVHNYGWGDYQSLDETMEALWKALPYNEIDNTIVVADGSGSMTCRVGNSGVTALEVTNSLAIYYAERSKGEIFRDKYITFSERPQFVDLSAGQSLRDKIQIAQKHCEVASTNIEAVFDLMLDLAVENKVAQAEIPNILIISDMEFNMATNPILRKKNAVNYQTLLAAISHRWENAGYKLPKCVFWNVNMRSGGIPMKQNRLGVALVSGFSQNIVKMIMSDEKDPLKVLIEALCGDRYKKIALKEI